MPKAKHQDKKKSSKKKDESEEEVSEEEDSEKQSEKSGSEGSDEERDESGDDESEKSKGSGSDGSDNSSDKSKDSDADDDSEEGSDKEEGSEDESDEDSEASKKKKKKGKGKEKDKEKKKKKDDGKDKKKDKGKKKEDDSKTDKTLSKKTTFDLSKNPTPSTLTISSVSKELDELSDHLAQVFPLFRNTQEQRFPTQKRFIEDYISSTYHQRGNMQAPQLEQEHSPIKASKKQAYSEPFLDHHEFRSPTKKGGDSHEKEDKGIQCEDKPQKNQHSPEAIRAVKEYKFRKEQEKKKAEKVDKSVGGTKNVVDSALQNSGEYEKYEKKERGKSRKEEKEYFELGLKEKEKERKDYFSPHRSGSQWNKSNQIAENYYGGVIKKAPREFASPDKKTVKDLYRQTPKPMYVESGQPLDKYTANGTQRRGQEVIEKYEQKFRQSGGINKSGSDSSKKDIREAMEVLMRKSKK